MILGSSVCIALKPVEIASNAGPIKDFPKWPAILFSFITPIFFLAAGLFNKHLTGPTKGFDATTLAVGTSCTVSILTLILGVSWYWVKVEAFNPVLFGVGIVASILDTTGKVFLQRAFSSGPIGPVAAITELNNVLLITIESVRFLKFPATLEIIGFVLGISGGMVFAIPDQIA